MQTCCNSDITTVLWKTFCGYFLNRNSLLYSKNHSKSIVKNPLYLLLCEIDNYITPLPLQRFFLSWPQPVILKRYIISHDF